MEKRRRDDSSPLLLHVQPTKSVRIDKGQLTLKRIMSAGHGPPTEFPSLSILCEGCHRRAPPAEPLLSSSALVGECRFCSRRSLCRECWSLCAKCGMETCPLCSVQDYSGRDTVAVCLDCKRHSNQKPLVRR